MSIPNGLIVMWSGAILNVPDGWHLCDGTGGTIDLRDKFIVGAGSTHDPADTGGATTHTHAFTGDGHIHTIGITEGGIAAGDDFDDITESTAVTGTTDAGSSLPPYYALAFIQKV